MIVVCLLFVIGFSHGQPILLAPHRIREHSPIGEQILTLPKINEFETTFSFRFVNSQQQNLHDYFKLNSSTGEIRLSADLDREVICPHRRLQCQFVLKIFELFHETLYHLPLIIEDVNDHRPEFPSRISSVNLHLSEHSPPFQSKLFLQSAYDEDQIDQEHPLEYHLNSSSKNFPFRLEIDQDDLTDRLALVLTETLDRETIDVYHCTLIVVDTAGHREELKIRILIDDVNDHSPVFERDAYFIGVSEKTLINSSILHVHANDNDIGRNSWITYDFTDASKELRSIFSIDSRTGVIRLRSKLDYEQRTNYVFYLEARDSGEDRRSTQTLVNITVINENDCPPTIDFRFLSELNFNNQNNRIDLSENYPIEKFFAQILVIDPDYPLTGRTTLWFEMNTNETCFHLYYIDQSTYLFNRSIPFDFESQQFYQIIFYAEDFDLTEPLQSNRTLYIQLHDENDHRPEFVQKNFHFSLEENNPLNLTVTRIEAFDRDSGDNGRISYAIVTNETDLPFHIDSRTGLLICLQSLDYEQRSKYEFEILAIDHGTPYRFSSKISLSIDIHDVNDHPPRFVPEKFYFSIPEDFPIGKNFAHVHAEDPDRHSHLIYRLTNNETFSINNRGQLSLKKRVDREQRDRYEFFAVVFDGIFESSVKILVSIFDINDCSPEWLIPKKNFSTIVINKDLFRPGSTIFQFRTIDRDDRKNGNGLVRYELVDQSNIFNINTRGELMTNVTPMIGRYALKITAKDQGEHRQLFSTIDFIVFIVDNRTNGSSFDDEFASSFNRLSTTKRFLLLSTFLISLAFLLIFVISLVFIVVCRYKTEQTDVYVKCPPSSTPLVIENPTNASETSFKPLISPSTTEWRLEKLLYPNWLYNETNLVRVATDPSTSTFDLSSKQFERHATERFHQTFI